MADSSSEAKQQFLREKILDKKEIEVNKFVDFLREKKGEDGEDIDNWTMEDLQEVVIEFYKINNISDDNKNDIEEEKIEEIDNQINEEEKEENEPKEGEKKEENEQKVIKEEIKNEIENNIINNEKKLEINGNIIKNEKVEIDNIEINNININKEEKNAQNENKEENKDIIDSNKSKTDEKDDSIKFIIDEDSLMDFMLTSKGLKKSKEEENKKSFNTQPIQNNKEKNLNANNTINNTINNTNNVINNINSNNNSNPSFNFEKMFNNNNGQNNQQKFDFEKMFQNNNININKGNNQQPFNFEKNFSKDLHNNTNNNNSVPKFNFEQNFKNNEQQFDFKKNFTNINNSNENNNTQQIKTQEKFNEQSNNISKSIDNIDNIKKQNIIQNNNIKNIESSYNIEKEDDKNNINKDNNNNSEYNTKNNNENENNTTSSNLTNFIDKNDHDSEYGIIIPEIIKCKKIENTEFSNHKDIVIKITDPIKVETSFFLGKSVNYLVTTSPFKYTVRRRYSDFLWLRETLINLFNTNLIPKITKKGKVTDDKHDDNLIKKRMKVLENFINFLTKDEIIKSSQIFYDFLTIQRDEDFQSKKKFYDKIKLNPMDDIRERKSLDGELKIKINKEKEIYLENIKDNSIYNSNIFKKLNNNFKLLQEEFTTVIKRFESISDVYRELYTISKNYLDQNTITETYAQMEIMFKKLSESFNTMKAFINGDIREYFKFVMNNYGNISEMVENIELTKNNYMKLSKNLISKKNDLFKKGDISKWEISSNDHTNSSELIKDKALACNKMLPKETKTCINSKEIYGFYLNRLISEFERMRQINAYFHKKKACHFCQEQIIICSNYTRILGDIIMVIDSCINKKH